jgi:hypothetical protein
MVWQFVGPLFGQFYNPVAKAGVFYKVADNHKKSIPLKRDACHMRKILLPQLYLFDPGMSCGRLIQKIPGVHL